GARGDDRTAAYRLVAGAAAAAAGVDAVGAVGVRDSAVAGGAGRLRPAAAGPVGAGARAPEHMVDAARFCACAAGGGVPAVGGGVQPGRDCPHGVAAAGLASPSAAMEPVQRGRPDAGGGCVDDVAHDVDRAGVRAAGRTGVGRHTSGGAAGGRAGAAGVVRLAMADVVAGHAARGTGGDVEPGPVAVPASAGTAHLGLL